jgi:flagellar motility protein MotE (MotC chaperone)
MTPWHKAIKIAPTRGTIILIAGLFIASSVIRIMNGTGAAVAEISNRNEISSPHEANHLETKQEVYTRTDIQSLLDAFAAREERIADKERRLNIRAKALEVSQVEIERRIDALENAEDRLRATLARAQTASEEDLTRLTDVYENMKPKNASALFGAMEPEFAAGFLARMRPDVAAKILSCLDPQIAYSISAILAGQNALAPKS